MNGKTNTKFTKNLNRLKKECGSIRADLRKTQNRVNVMEMVIEELRHDIEVELTEEQPERPLRAAAAQP